MILRKPYAFLIKNFKKIHIVLLVLSLFVAYKLIDVNSYVKEFMRLGTYDFFGDPISKHINIWLNLCIFLLVIGSAALLWLLHYKKKPWKVYLIPIVEYIALFFVLSMIRSFFNGYSSEIEVTDVRLARDLLMIFGFAQGIAIAVFIMRVFGLDIKKFQFNSDAEFLELNEEDRAEFEIGLNFDKHSIIRAVKRLFRNLKYIYLEHKLICLSIIGVFVLFSGLSLARYIFITNKSYSEGDFYSVNNYTFQVNNVYVTDKDFNGNVISDKSNFVIVDLTIQNHEAARTVYLENFHIRNGTEDYTTTKRIYAKEFQDLGTAYESSRKINKGESLNQIIIYKVDKKLKKDRFVLYYQEKSGTLRKIKLNVKDISKVEDVQILEVGDEIPLNFKNKEDVLRIDLVSLEEETSYVVKICSVSNCNYRQKDLVAPNGYRIMEIRFSSDVFEAKNIIDFLKNYGKLNYRDSEDEEYVLEIENATSEAYDGKTVFLKVPVDFEQAKEVYFDFVIRNKHYIYKLLGGLYEEENT